VLRGDKLTYYKNEKVITIPRDCHQDYSHYGATMILTLFPSLFLGERLSSCRNTNLWESSRCPRSSTACKQILCPSPNNTAYELSPTRGALFALRQTRTRFFNGSMLCMSNAHVSHERPNWKSSAKQASCITTTTTTTTVMMRLCCPIQGLLVGRPISIRTT